MKFLIRAFKMLFYVSVSFGIAFLWLYIGYEAGKSDGYASGFMEAMQNTHFATESDIKTMIATCEAYHVR